MPTDTATATPTPTTIVVEAPTASATPALRPLAVNDAVGILEGQAVTIPVLANDVDLGGGGLAVVSLTQPTHGQAVIVAGEQQITYLPSQTFQGVDNFTYTVQDTQGYTDTALVALVVSAKNDTGSAPQVGAVAVITDTHLTFPASQVQLEIAVPAGVYTAPLGAKDVLYFAFAPNLTEANRTEQAPAGFRFGNMLFDLSAYLNATRFDHFYFTKPVTVTLTYDPALLDTSDPQSLVLLYWNGTAWASDGITLLAHDLANHRLTVLLNHLSEFALFVQAPTPIDTGPEPTLSTQLFLPLIVRDEEQ